VEEGTVNADSGWVVSTDGAITLGTTNFDFVQFSGAGQITAGNGLTKDGNIINAAGTTNRISVGADAIDIHANYVGQNSITTLGAVTTGSWEATDVAVAHGGTGLSTITVNGVMYGSGTSAVGVTAAGVDNAILYSNSGTPAWTTAPDGLTVDCGTF
jgi:hypothetical protein